MFRSFICASAVIFAVSPSSAAELLAPESLKSDMFDARPITTTDSKGRASQLVFAPDGTLKRIAANGRASEGVWRLSEDGFCMQAGQQKRESCYIVLKRPDGHFTALRRSSQSFLWQRQAEPVSGLDGSQP